MISTFTLIVESLIESTYNYIVPFNALLISVHINMIIDVIVIKNNMPPHDYLLYWLSYNLGNRLIII